MSAIKPDKNTPPAREPRVTVTYFRPKGDKDPPYLVDIVELHDLVLLLSRRKPSGTGKIEFPVTVRKCASKDEAYRVIRAAMDNANKVVAERGRYEKVSYGLNDFKKDGRETLAKIYGEKARVAIDGILATETPLSREFRLAEERQLAEKARQERELLMARERMYEQDEFAGDRKSTRLNSSHNSESRMPSSA
jgi:hypothetical protein